jgi:hypothetical protein
MRYLRIVPFILFLVGLPLFWYSVRIHVPVSPVDESGVNAGGVFKPGGFFRLEFDTGIESLKGYYQGQVEVVAILDEIQAQKEIKWPNIQKEIGEGWGDTISSLGSGIDYDKLMVNVPLSIPDDPLLSGEKISLDVMVDLTYPVHAGVYGKFLNERALIRKDVEIIIQKSQLSLWETIHRWNVERGTGRTAVFIVSWILWAFSLLWTTEELEQQYKKRKKQKN